jgi:hypothetical protein
MLQHGGHGGKREQDARQQRAGLSAPPEEPDCSGKPEIVKPDGNMD